MSLILSVDYTVGLPLVLLYVIPISLSFVQKLKKKFQPLKQLYIITQQNSCPFDAFICGIFSYKPRHTVYIYMYMYIYVLR